MSARIDAFDRFDENGAYMGWWKLDASGTPVPCKSMNDLHTEGVDARRVAREKVVPGVDVSTVFLGLDHGYGDGPPILYETMVFGGTLDGEQDRYATREQALAGHEAMKQRVLADIRQVTP